METPNTPAGHLTEHIMLAIREHIKDTELDPTRFDTTNHFNRAWELVHAILDGVDLSDRDEGDLPAGLLCGKLFVPRHGASFSKCGLLWNHKGKCEPRK